MDVQQKYSKMNNSAKYAYLIESLSKLIQSKNCDKNLLQTYLSDLTELNYKPFIIDDNITMILISNLCATIQPADTELVKINCQYLINLIKNETTFHGITFMVCFQWVLDSLQFSESSTLNNVLLALHNLLNIAPHNINRECKTLFLENGSLWKHVIPQNNQWIESNFLALRCLETFLIKGTQSESSISFEYLSAIKSVTLKTLCIVPENINDSVKLLFNKIASLCLHIQRIIVSNTDISAWPDIIGEITGILQVYLFYGVKSYPIMKPETLRPAQLNIPEREQPIPKRSTFFQHKAKERRQRMKRCINENRNITNSVEFKGNYSCSSDSETSETELFDGVTMDWKVRLKAVQLLHALLRAVSSHEFFGYWTQIITSGTTGATNARVLTRFLLKVHDSKARQYALILLTELVESARKFLLHAEDVEHVSFLSFFGMVSDMIKELHFMLSLLSSTVQHKLVLTQVLKCASALVQSTPYSRMKPGLPTKLIRNCRAHLLHSDPTIRVAVLLVFEAIASANPITPEILSILENTSIVDIDTDLDLNTKLIISDVDAEDGEEEEVEEDDEKIKELNLFEENKNVNDYNIDRDLREKNMSSLVRVCLHNISNEQTRDPVRIQSLRLLGTLASSTGNLIFPYLEIVAATLVKEMLSLEQQIVLHTCRVVDAIAGRLGSPEFSHIDPSIFWDVIFDSVISLAQHTQIILREAACNCLSNIGSNMLSRLSREKIILIITILFGAARDEETAVRAAGIRALGVLVATFTMEEDAGFLMDLADMACLATEDQNLGVRVKAVWALASLCDCLLRRENKAELEPVPLEIVIPKLYEASVTAAKDNNKVKSNAVRAIGSILCLCSEQEIIKDTTDGLNALISCATKGFDMKLRWNACHALGLILSRKPDLILPSSWKDEVFPILCNLICDSPNFKVRINAAWALSVCTSFGKYIPTIWKSIILALENSQHVPNYVEYAHHDGLIQQLCLAFCHVALYTELHELNTIWSEIGEHIKDISPFMKHFRLRILPEKSGDLTNVKIQFDKYLQNASTQKEKQIAEALVNLLEKADI